MFYGWQDILVLMLLAAAVVHLVRRIRRAGKSPCSCGPSRCCKDDLVQLRIKQ
ncbi:MAG: FeoB-associated Cys-rich membrane protein [Pirellulales bacterium]